MERVLAVALLLFPVGLASQPQPDPPPALLLGTFVDDYRSEYEITPGSWRHGEHALYVIEEWMPADRFLLVSAQDDGRGRLWTRIDWVVFEPGGDYDWAYCYAVYDQASAVGARTGPASSRATPRDGCNGFPFSRMRRAGEDAVGRPRSTR